VRDQLWKRNDRGALDPGPLGAVVPIDFAPLEPRGAWLMTFRPSAQVARMFPAPQAEDIDSFLMSSHRTLPDRRRLDACFIAAA
jgi:hypothetical protein